MAHGAYFELKEAKKLLDEIRLETKKMLEMLDGQIENALICTEAAKDKKRPDETYEIYREAFISPSKLNKKSMKKSKSKKK